jgi:5,10-methylene-tetrahydrofolate dehydrogenase/methenyl tetrahydrofolate cyclohydrolase
MNELNNNALILAVVVMGALFVIGAAVRRWRNYDLSGKTVLITGASRGLGLVMARELIREGARLAICARDEAELERAHADLLEGVRRCWPCRVM